MEQAPFTEANCFSTAQIPSILCKPQVRWHVYKSLALVHMLGQTDPVHIPPSQNFKYHFNVSFVYSPSFP